MDTVLDQKKQVKEQPVGRSVQIWLLAGLVLVFFQVVIGGVTRLTDSGLSITEWEVIQGTLPPLNATQWEEAFAKYKVAAKKQYESLHAGMSLSEFKVIYFWEYFHRLWARMMGLVFFIPFLIFLFRRQLPGWLLRRLGIVILLAVAAAVFGWIMVTSGLNNDQRTWVSAYKLIIHLGIATALFSYLFWTYLIARVPQWHGRIRNTGLQRFVLGITLVFFVQILLGGLMAGMRAGLIHPHFPFFVKSGAFFEALGNTASINAENILNYEPSTSLKAWIQVFHRGTAYLLVLLISWLVWKYRKLNFAPFRWSSLLLISVLVIQFLLGVITVINAIGGIPVSWGALHQGVALVVLLPLLIINFFIKKC